MLRNMTLRVSLTVLDLIQSVAVLCIKIEII